MRRLFSVAAVCAGLGSAPALAAPDVCAAPLARAEALERRVEALERALAVRRTEPHCGGAEDADAWRLPERWAQLRRGISRFDALRILGEPGVVASYDGFERWEYPDLRGGRLHFDELGTLIGWRLPPALRPANATPR